MFNMSNDAIQEKVKNSKLHSFDDVKELFYAYITNQESRKLVEDAYELAKEKHKTQFRRSGEPYIHHLIEVCYILATLNCGPTTLAAGLLHDVIEDTDTTLDEIKNLFGEEVCSIVNSLTKIQRMKLSHRPEDEFVAEDHRKIFLGMAKDVRVIVIKLADRLHNMRTLDSLPPHRQLALAKETLEVFTPIAHRLGINTIKTELEDLSIKYLEPEKYQVVVDLVNRKIKYGQKSLDSFTKRIVGILMEKNIPFELESRVKSIYSIYRKIYLKNHKPEEIYDLLAIRIITHTELECYEILGIIHATYTPLPGRFKDYIAVPKPNMYQSLHTCIISGDGNIFEVQIRTKEMDEIAESGIAAHWRYKEGTNYNPKQEQKEIEEKLHWLKDLVNLSENEETSDAKEYMNSLSHDIFEANVYCFTPKGKVIDLPAGSTPIDFAYKIHTGVAEKMVGAIINNQMVPLTTVLKTGDIVEIKTSKTSLGPNEDWLKIATTSFAKSHIRKFLSKKNANFVKDEKITRGKQACLEAFKNIGFGESQTFQYIEKPEVLSHFGFDEVDDLYVAISNKNPIPAAIIDFLGIRPKEEIRLDKKERFENDGCPVYVNGASKIAINLAPCCTPIPGDEIVGYITKGKGITVHRKDCPNIINEKQRLIEVFWKPNLEKGNYPVDIRITCNDRQNLLTDVMNVLNQNGVPVTAINAHLHTSTMETVINVTIYVSDSERLQDIFNILKNVKNVNQLERLIH